jgi:predicted metalloprotease
MRTKSPLLVLALATALAAAGCGSKKDETSPSTPTAPGAAKNKHFKSPSTPQPDSATKKPNKKTIAALPRAPKPGEGKAPQIKGLEGKSIEDKLEIIATDIGNFWQKGFSTTDIKFRQVNTFILSGSLQIGCDPPGSIATTDQPFYCPADNSLILPVESLKKTDEDPNRGDAGVATIVAAYYGLHVEDVVGLLTDRPGQKVLETAICFAGVWASSVYDRGLLDPGDLDKVAATLVSGSSDSADTNALIDAFNAGYRNGKPGDCVQSNGDAGTGG